MGNVKNKIIKLIPRNFGIKYKYNCIKIGLNTILILFKNVLIGYVNIIIIRRILMDLYIKYELNCIKTGLKTIWSLIKICFLD